MADLARIATERSDVRQTSRARKVVKKSVRGDAPTIVVGDKTYVVVAGDVAVVSIDDFAVAD